MKLNESLSNLAERITTELRSYPGKIIAQFQLKLWEIPISCKNTTFLPKNEICLKFDARVELMNFNW